MDDTTNEIVQTANEPPAELQPATENQAADKPTEEPRYPGFVFGGALTEAKTVMSILNSIADEIPVSLYADKLEIRAVDHAHVAMITCELAANDIVSMDTVVGDAGKNAYGFDVEKISDALKAFRGSDNVIFSLDKHNGRVPNLVIQSGRIVREIATIDSSNFSDIKVPNFVLPASVTVNAKELYQALQSLAEIEDHVSITITGQRTLEIAAKNDNDSAKALWDENELKSWNGQTDCNFRSMFPLDYLRTTLKVIGDVDIQLEVGINYPLRASFAIGHWHFTYLLAPRVES